MVGAIEAGGVRYVAAARPLSMLTPDGTAVDTLRGEALPDAPLLGIGVTGQVLMITTPRSNFLTQDGLAWEKTPLKPSAWSTPQPLPAYMRAEAAIALAAQTTDGMCCA